MSGEGKLTTQAVDDFEILLGRNDASADAEVGVEILASFDEDVTNTKVAAFAGWDVDVDASLSQFARGNQQAYLVVVIHFIAAPSVLINLSLDRYSTSWTSQFSWHWSCN